MKRLGNSKLSLLSEKHRELVAYLFVGGLTTLVSFGTYWLYSRVFGIENEHVAKFLSMLTAMVFSFYPNKVWVFRSTDKRGKELVREVVSFFASRSFSAFVVEQGLFAFFIEVIKMYDLIANIIVMVIIVILNYVLSKFIVFRRSQRCG